VKSGALGQGIKEGETLPLTLYLPRGKGSGGGAFEEGSWNMRLSLYFNT